MTSRQHGPEPSDGSGSKFQEGSVAFRLQRSFAAASVSAGAAGAGAAADTCRDVSPNDDDGYSDAADAADTVQASEGEVPENPLLVAQPLHGESGQISSRETKHPSVSRDAMSSLACVYNGSSRTPLHLEESSEDDDSGDFDRECDIIMDGLVLSDDEGGVASHSRGTYDKNGHVLPREQASASAKVVSPDNRGGSKAPSSAMHADSPLHRRGSWSGNASGESPHVTTQKQRHSFDNNMFRSVDIRASSPYEAKVPYTTTKPPPRGGLFTELDDEESDSDEIRSVGVSSTSSSSSDSISIASDDICVDEGSFELTADEYVPCSFVTSQRGPDSTNLLLNESVQNLGYTISASSIVEGKAVGSINPAYLDVEMAAGIMGGKLPAPVATKFVREHHLFLRAVLQLMAERDRVGVEANMDDPHTIKSGSLKKSSTNIPGVWKVKFVEIRRGIFSYYEDKASTAGESLIRRNIPLRTSLCTVRAVKLPYLTLSDVGPKTSLFGGSSKSGSGGFVFELSVQGNGRRLWMASSNEERQAWIRAIHEGMLGVSSISARGQVPSQRGSANSSKHPLFSSGPSPADDVDRYLQIQSALKSADTESAYASIMSRLWETSLRIPVQRIREQAETVASYDSPRLHHDTRTRLERFWDDLSRNVVSLNGHVLHGDVKYGPERMVGALTRGILEYDQLGSEQHSSTDSRRPNNLRRADSGVTTELITEVQAIGYARDILFGCNRPGTGMDDDSFFSVETLCGNNGFSVLIPISSQVEPVGVHVSSVNVAECDELTNENRSGNALERTGWVECKGKSSKKWKRRFCVLSEGVISYYENGYPRPHGLRDQLVLVGASMGFNSEDEKSGDESGPCSPERSVRQHIISIRTRDQSRAKHYIAFDNSVDMMSWAEAIRSSIESCSPGGAPEESTVSDAASPYMDSDGNETKKSILRGFKPPFIAGVLNSDGDSRTPRSSSPVPQQEFKGIFGTLKSSKGDENDAGTGSSRSGKESKDAPKKSFFPTIKRSGAGMGMATLQAYKYPDASVRVTVQASTMYKLCTANGNGDEVLGTVRTKILRNYLLAGGPNGRMIRGEDVVEMEFLKGIVREETFQLIFEKNNLGAQQKRE
mmetsp:Transcript_3680/g.7148  ORF Transcript_3680/g.7148 Transcript_3680/m.7148 type:complete len:1111 (-) Transcript_3680:1120-4452(-)|eukprot:CAMPEP_0178731694 /NCGR_PEP_ID=MMETSP0699-20121125/30173_1 /TAXON_ID=265572 /ORGANISM="Extubocellulus spinifer, Strain CCMP396" /LENGTH=1110 /DNA_ID=CAMNT_0020383771 /DNA_START=212 /DNA_END=3544 /DNA_ORIENTATION=-